MFKLISSILIITLTVCMSLSADRPLQLSFTPEIALHDRTETITGLTLGIWGENPQAALAIGVIQGSTGRSGGVSWAFILNYAEDYTGVQWAPANYTSGDFLGWQAGFANYAGGSMTGLQTGTLNFAGRMAGVQVGFLNYAAIVDSGLQIGLINLMLQNEWFTRLPNELAPAMVFVNWRL